MTAQPINDLELIEHLDWEHTPQCEHSTHGTSDHHDDGPAYVLVRSECPVCEDLVDLYLCRRKWDACIAGHYVKCNQCLTVNHSHRVYTPLGWVE